MGTLEQENICKRNKKGTHLFIIKYKNYNYCKFCGACQALGGFPISEDLMEHLIEDHDALSEESA